MLHSVISVFLQGEIAFKKEELLRKKLILEKMIIQKQKLIDDVLEMTDGEYICITKHVSVHGGSAKGILSLVALKEYYQLES